MSNYSTLQENTLLGLSETAGCLYLKLCDVFQGHTPEGERKAFLAACEYDEKCGLVLDYILRKFDGWHGGPLVEKTLSELSQFFAERWRHNFMVAA